MRFHSLVLCLTVCFGCRGPLAAPMVQRLGPEAQQRVENTWADVLARGDDVDATLMLDALLLTQFYQHGVDSLHMVSEKRVGNELVVMQVNFELEDPDGDEFTFSHYDPAGREVRNLRWTPGEIRSRMELFHQPELDPNSLADEERADYLERKAEREARLAQLDELLASLKATEEPTTPATTPNEGQAEQAAGRVKRKR